eukprot:scaffold1307_cov30-Attheya_sp.AAC.2
MNRERMSLVRPPYVDPTTNICYDTDSADYQGWLTKQSMWLKGSKLFFARSEYSAPHGMVDLSLCTTVKSADLKAHKRNSFEVSTAETTFLLYADSEKEKDDWIGSIGRSIVRCSSTYNRQPTSNVDGDDDDSDTYSNSSNNPYFND